MVAFGTRHRPQVASDRLLRIHRGRQHGGQLLEKKNFVCHICAEGFTSGSRLRDHEVMAHGSPDDYQHECPQCRKKFGKKCRWCRYLQTHTTERNFKCPTCQKRFKTMQNLRQHLKSHGPPKHECEVCDRKFSFCAGLLNHLRTIHGLKKPKTKVSLFQDFETNVPFEDSLALLTQPS